MIELPTSDFHRMAVEDLNTAKLLAHATNQRDRCGLEDFFVFDADCHHYENESLREIIEFIEDPVLKHGALMSNLGGTGTITSLLPSSVGHQDLSGRITRYPLRKTERTAQGRLHRDVQLTQRWMDAMGVD